MGDMGLEYGNEKRVCTPFDVVLAFFVSVLIVLKFVGEYGMGEGSGCLLSRQTLKRAAASQAAIRAKSEAFAGS